MLRTVKMLVAAMGVLIVLGLGLLAYGVSRDTPPSATPPPATATGVAAGFAPVALSLPEGAAVIETTLAPDRMAIRVRLAGNTPVMERIYVIDLIEGKLLGQIDIADGR